MKNILVLTGSPRKNGNSERMANAFIKGAQSVGHETVKFETARKKISDCKDCGACWIKGKPCSFQDDFDELAPLLESADVIVIATPLYWFSFTGYIKVTIDKMNAYLKENSKRHLKIKESILLVCGADKGIEIFDGIIVTYKQICKYMNWEDKGVLAVPNVRKKDDIEKTDALNRAEKLGRLL